MGIDVHTLNFLRYCYKKQEFGDIATIGRHGYHILSSYTKDPFILKITKDIYHDRGDLYCEDMFLSVFKASKVDSFDASEYEGATFVRDFNNPIPERFENQYSTVLDAGTLEHVFNVPVAFENCSRLCKAGGQIIHVLPANNFCGHGFYQYSPEFFFALYSEKRGYRDTEVFLANLADSESWFKVKKPRAGMRAVIHSCNRVHMLVRTVRVDGNSHGQNIYQSDYCDRWDGNAGENSTTENSTRRSFLERIANSSFVSQVLRHTYHRYYRLRPSPRLRLNKFNPCIEKIKVSDLL